ncbi:MAG: DUF4212 domain-containing protein [Planctomycetota bacterium]|nr:DUF4212 domain-containing protein [Planctomycetota bacterium]
MPVPEVPSDQEAQVQEEHRRYWRTNLRVLVVLLSVWFGVSCLLGIVFAEPLNRIQFGGFPLGFWFAQQGSIYVFILLILFYAWLMDREDRKFHVEQTGQPADVEEDA